MPKKHLSVMLEPDLLRRIKIEAIHRNLSLSGLTAAVLLNFITTPTKVRAATLVGATIKTSGRKVSV